MKTISNNRLLQSGFSLIEIMVATTILAFMSVTIADVIVSQSKNVSYLEDRVSYQNLKQQLSEIFSDSSVCIDTFQGFAIPNIGVDSASRNKISNPTKVFYDLTSDATNQYDELKIDSVKVRNVSVAGPSSSGDVKILIGIKRKRKGGGGEMFKTVELDRVVDVNASKKIINCIDPNAVTEDIPGECITMSSNSGHPNSARTITVPSDAKYVNIFIPGDTVSRGGDNDCRNSISSASIWLRIDGNYSYWNTSNPSRYVYTSVRAGRVLTLPNMSSRDSTIYYDGIPLATTRTCELRGGIDCECSGTIFFNPGASQICHRNDTTGVSFWK